MRIALFSAVLLTFASPALAGDLTVWVSGLPSDAGTVRAALFADEASFKAKSDPVAAIVVKPHDKTARFTVADLPAGRYALAVFQDVNDNGKLDANMIGMPTEPWGFSNDALGKFGPPDFNQTAFDVAADATTISVTVHK